MNFNVPSEINKKLKELDEFIKDKKSTLILYVYDSFLFDFSKEDGKETLIKIKEIVSKKHPINIKTGKVK